MSFSSLNDNEGRTQGGANGKAFGPVRVTFLLIGLLLAVVGGVLITWPPAGIQTVDTIAVMSPEAFGAFVADKGRFIMVLVGFISMALSVFGFRKNADR